MRDYKFRGKTKNGEWVYGSLFLINEKSYIYERNYGDLDDIDFGRGFEEVLPETVGQFTGLLDRNGVEIYEGDVSRVDLKGMLATATGSISRFDGVGKVIFGFLKGQYGVKIIDAPPFTPCYIPLYDGSAEFEVIGNTHDNSYLLESK